MENYNEKQENSDKCNSFKAFYYRQVVKSLLDLELLTYFQPLSHFYIAWKHQKTFSDVFRGYWRGTLVENGLN